MTLIASAIQMNSSDDVEHNFENALRLLKIAINEHGANLIVFPENFLCFGHTQQKYLASNLRNYLSKFQALAAKKSISLVLGSVPSLLRENGQETDGRYRSASFVINEVGLICCQYDKINLFDVDVNDAHGRYRESELYEAGSAVKVVDVLEVRLGLSICYDLRFPDLFQSLSKAEANVLVVPAAFTKVTGQAHWEVLLRARAIETQSYLIAANQCGTHSGGRETWGRSMIIDPWGEIIAKHEIGAGVCSAPLDLLALNQIRASMPLNQILENK